MKGRNPGGLRSYFGPIRATLHCGQVKVRYFQLAARQCTIYFMLTREIPNEPPNEHHSPRRTLGYKMAEHQVNHYLWRLELLVDLQRQARKFAFLEVI